MSSNRRKSQLVFAPIAPQEEFCASFKKDTAPDTDELSVIFDALGRASVVGRMMIYGLVALCAALIFFA